MLRCVALTQTYVSEVCIASIIRVTISELGTTLAVKEPRVLTSQTTVFSYAKLLNFSGHENIQFEYFLLSF
jgi:hypothetical protein